MMEGIGSLSPPPDKTPTAPAMAVAHWGGAVIRADPPCAESECEVPVASFQIGVPSHGDSSHKVPQERHAAST